ERRSCSSWAKSGPGLSPRRSSPASSLVGTGRKGGITSPARPRVARARHSASSWENCKVGALRLSFVPWGLPVLAGVYFVAGKLGLTLAFVHASATAVWPPTGIALAAALLLGYRVWPALFVGAFLVNVTTEGSVWTSLGIASGNTLAGLLGTAVSATIGVTSLALGGYASWGRFGAIWLTWWLGDVAGALVVAPALILWSTDRTVRLTGARAMELALLLGSVVVVGLAVFGGLGSAWVREYPLEFLCIPLLILAAFRFALREPATCVVLLSVIATWGTLRGAGRFVWDTQNESLLLLQGFMRT